MRVIIGKSLRLPLVGRIWAGLSFRPRCQNCGRPVGFLTGLLGWAYLTAVAAGIIYLLVRSV